MSLTAEQLYAEFRNDVDGLYWNDSGTNWDENGDGTPTWDGTATGSDGRSVWLDRINRERSEDEYPSALWDGYEVQLTTPGQEGAGKVNEPINIQTIKDAVDADESAKKYGLGVVFEGTDLEVHASGGVLSQEWATFQGLLGGYKGFTKHDLGMILVISEASGDWAASSGRWFVINVAQAGQNGIAQIINESGLTLPASGTTGGKFSLFYGPVAKQAHQIESNFRLTPSNDQGEVFFTEGLKSAVRRLYNPLLDVNAPNDPNPSKNDYPSLGKWSQTWANLVALQTRRGSRGESLQGRNITITEFDAAQRWGRDNDNSPPFSAGTSILG